MRSFFFALIITLTCLPSAWADAQKGSDVWYQQHGVTIVNQPDAAPMSYQDESGNPRGFIIDVWKKWSQVTGIPVRFEFANWSENIRGTASGKYDIHGGLMFVPERAKILDYANPYLTVSMSLVVLAKHDADIETIQSSYRIGLLSQSHTDHEMRGNISKRHIFFKTFREIVHNLDADKIHAAIGYYPILAYELKKLDPTALLIRKKTTRAYPFHSAVAKGNRVLLDLVNSGFESIGPESMELIHKRWFVTEAPEQAWFKEILIGLLVVIISAAVFYYFSSRRIQAF